MLLQLLLRELPLRELLPVQVLRMPERRLFQQKRGCLSYLRFCFDLYQHVRSGRTFDTTGII